MHVFAAVVPPRDVLEELREVVIGVSPDGKPNRRGSAPAAASGRAAHRAETSGRFRLRRERPERRVGFHDQLDVMPLDRMMLPVAPFGNLARADAERLVEVIAAEAATWPRPTVHFHGGGALEWPGDTGVWSRMGGDLDAMQEIGRSVPRVAQRLSLFVDRRVFRPWQQVGTITDATTAPYLEGLVAALDAFTGKTWVQEHITLFRGKAEGGLGWEETVELPLSPERRG